jgi:hypothetical protein
MIFLKGLKCYNELMNKVTLKELSIFYGISESTLKRLKKGSEKQQRRYTAYVILYNQWIN